MEKSKTKLKLKHLVFYFLLPSCRLQQERPSPLLQSSHFFVFLPGSSASLCFAAIAPNSAKQNQNQSDLIVISVTAGHNALNSSKLQK